jgi:hypothetical protein
MHYLLVSMMTQPARPSREGIAYLILPAWETRQNKNGNFLPCEVYQQEFLLQKNENFTEKLRNNNNTLSQQITD